MDKNIKLVFIHNTKTAGVSIVDTLKEVEEFYNHGHRPVSSVASRIGSIDNITFTVVRNPFSRIWSQYNFYKIERNIIDERISFEEFVLTYDTYSYVRDNTFKTCFELVSIDGRVAVDYVLKFETLKQDWKKFSNKFNLPRVLQIVNTLKKPPTNFNTLYTLEMRTTVENLFQKDLEEFGYSYKNFKLS